MRNFLFSLRRLDWLLFFAMLFLLFLSASILYSLNLNIEASDFLIFRKQIIFILLGLFLFFVVSNINYRVWFTFSKLIYILFALVLVAVVVFGRELKGTTGWIIIGPFSLQPVEFAKVACLVLLARYFSDNAREFYMLKHIIISGLIVLFYVGLVMLQPDLGSALVMVGIWVVMILFTGLPKKYLLWLLAIFVVTVTCAWFFVFAPYQKARIMVFLNPGLDPQGRGYNVLQSITAVGSGQLFGRGLSLGSQSSLRFLPEPGTDFIFAVIAEDLGFFGVLLTVGLLAFIIYRLFGIMSLSQDDQGSYLILGIVAMILVQSFINIGMNMGISPVTGIPLPLVSGGGSSLWSMMIALGMVQSVYVRNR